LNRRVLSLALIVLLVATVTALYLYGPGSSSQSRFRTAKIERGNLNATVSTTGTLNAVITVQVGTQVSGQISELPADFNSQVKKGQLIARISPLAFEAKLSQARAEVEAAEANVLTQRAQVERSRAEVAAAEAQVHNQRSQVLRATAEVDNAVAALAAARAQTAKARVALLDARRDLDRKLDLFGKELISRSERDTAQAGHDSAAAQVEASEAQERALSSLVRSAEAQLGSSRAQVDAIVANVRATEAQFRVTEAQLRSVEASVKQKQAVHRQAQIDLDNTFIRSPVDGIVVSRSVDVGQTVAASLSAPTLFTIAQDLSKMQVDTNVDEADIGRVEPGQRATFTVDSFRGETFTGEVTQIRQAAKVVQNVVTYNVVVAVDNPRQKLLPGLTTNLRIVVDSRPQVLKVPNAALRFRPDGDDASSSGATDSGSRADSKSLRPNSVEAVEAMRQQLGRDLKLSEPQLRSLEPILEEQRQQLAGAERLPRQQRRAATLRIREEIQGKIRAVLTPEQVKLFEQLPAGQPAGVGGGRPGTVWMMNGRGALMAVPVRLGISDGYFTELLEGDLKEGQELVVGTATSATATPGPAPASAPGSAPRVRF
jgi:HlyD family secretion protein